MDHINGWKWEQWHVFLLFTRYPAFVDDSHRKRLRHQKIGWESFCNQQQTTKRRHLWVCLVPEVTDPWTSWAHLRADDNACIQTTCMTRHPTNRSSPCLVAQHWMVICRALWPGVRGCRMPPDYQRQTNISRDKHRLYAIVVEAMFIWTVCKQHNPSYQLKTASHKGVAFGGRGEIDRSRHYFVTNVCVV